MPVDTTPSPYIDKVLSPDDHRVIAKGCRDFLRSVMPGNAPPAQVIDTANAFYGGAIHLFAAIMEGLSPGPDAQESDEHMLDTIDAEIRDFRQRLERLAAAMIARGLKPSVATSEDAVTVQDVRDAARNGVELKPPRDESVHIVLARIGDGPDYRFVEVETASGESIRCPWVDRPDGNAAIVVHPRGGAR